MDVQLWDDDMLNSSDFISSCTIGFWHLIEESLRTERKAVMYESKGLIKKKREDRFFIKTKPNPSLLTPALIVESRVKISVELVPKHLYFNL